MSLLVQLGFTVFPFVEITKASAFLAALPVVHGNDSLKVWLVVIVNESGCRDHIN